MIPARPSCALAIAAVALFSSTLSAQCSTRPPGPPPNATEGGSVQGPGGGTQPGASGPSTPSSPGRPGGPSSPGTGGGRQSPAGPTTPGPGLPRLGRGGPSTGGGSPATPRGGGMTFERSDASLDKLAIVWDFPTPKTVGRVMSFERALKHVRGDDPRPLLILRECPGCHGTDRALLRGELADDELTRLLTKWFHCVKLPPSLVFTAHPYNGLFAGDPVPHVVLASHDGELVVPLRGDQPQSVVHAAMSKVLRRHYQGRPLPVAKQLRKLLDRFDVVDTKRKELVVQLDRAVERHGRDADRSKTLAKKRDAVDKEFARLEKAERELIARLRPRVPTGS